MAKNQKKAVKYCTADNGYKLCGKRLKPNEQIICMECRRKAQLLMRGY